MSNDLNKQATIAAIERINAVEGFDPSVLAVDYSDLSSNETRRRLPVMSQMAWFRLKYPEGRIAVTVTAAKSTPIHFLILIFFNVCFMVVPPVHWLSFPYFLQSLYLPGPYSVNLRYSFIPVAKV